MEFEGIGMSTGMFFRTYSEESLAEEVEIEDLGIEAPQIGIEYIIPDGYVTTFAEDDNMYFNTKDGSNYISISVMKETPLTGIIDEFPHGEFADKGYRAKEQIGPTITYSYLFEKDSSTYLVSSDDKSAFDALIKSLSF